MANGGKRAYDMCAEAIYAYGKIPTANARKPSLFLNPSSTSRLENEHGLRSIDLGSPALALHSRIFYAPNCVEDQSRLL